MMARLCSRAQVRHLSDSKKTVSWRLNDLLRAGEKAKSFAAINWTDGSSGSHSGFKSWTPGDISSPVEGEIISEGSIDDSLTADNVKSSEDILEQAKSEAYSKGFQDGVDQEKLDQDQLIKNLQSLFSNINENQKVFTEFFDPVKKLSLNIAKYLVKGNLTVSSDLINKIIDTTLSEITNLGDKTIIVEMNSTDFENLNDVILEQFENVEFSPNSELGKGDLRIKMNDSIIEDFIENRLSDIAESLMRGDFLEQKESKPGEDSSVKKEEFREDLDDQVEMESNPEQSLIENEASDSIDSGEPDES